MYRDCGSVTLTDYDSVCDCRSNVTMTVTVTGIVTCCGSDWKCNRNCDYVTVTMTATVATILTCP